jgi:hypothetical protein
LDYDPGKWLSAGELLEDPWFVGIAAALGRVGRNEGLTRVLYLLR